MYKNVYNIKANLECYKPYRYINNNECYRAKYNENETKRLIIHK